MSCTPQAPTVFVNHVVPLQHTDIGGQTDFRRKVTPEIGVTTQNSRHLAHNNVRSPKLTLRQLRDKLPNSFKNKSKYSKLSKEDVMTTYTELRDQHMYMLNAKYTKKTFKQTSR